MNEKEFFEKLGELVKLYNTNGSKLETAMVEDALAFCQACAAENNTEKKAPADHEELMIVLLNGAGKNEKYLYKKWKSYVGGCGPIALTPNNEAIRDHYLTSEQIVKYNLGWNSYPPGYKDWQEFEASRLHAAADMLVHIAFSLGLFKNNR